MLLVGAGAVYLYVTRSTAPFADEWLWALNRRGSSLSTFLAPYNGHFALVPLLVYKVLWATAGLRTYLPYRVIVIALHLGCCALMFIYARRRIGNAAGVLAASSLLFYGPGWQDFLWPFQIGWLSSIAFGLLAFVALDHQSRRAEIAACVALVLSLASSGVGAPIAAGAAVDVLASRQRRRRAWIAGAPLALYALWWITEQRSAIAAGGPEHTPAFVLHMFAASLSGLLGLWHANPGVAAAPVAWRIALVAVAASLLLWGLARRFRVRALVFAGIAIAFAVAAGVNRAGLSTGVDSRYLDVVAVFAVSTMVELMTDWRPHRPGLLVAAAVLVGIVAVSNLTLIRDAGKYLRAEASQARADISALELARTPIASSYVAQRFPGYPFIALPARRLLTTVHELGFRAATNFRRAPEGERAIADGELAEAAGVYPVPVNVQAARLGGCVHLRGGAGVYAAATGVGGLTIVLPRPGVLVTGGGVVTVVAVRRLAAEFGNTGIIIGNRTMLVRASPDQLRLPWQIRVTPSSRAVVCPLR
jgi:hypothetical protein